MEKLKREYIQTTISILKSRFRPIGRSLRQAKANVFFAGSSAGQRHRAGEQELVRLGREAFVLGDRNAAGTPKARVAELPGAHEPPHSRPADARAAGKLIRRMV